VLRETFSLKKAPKIAKTVLIICWKGRVGVIEAVDEGLGDLHLELRPDKKVQLVITLCEMFGVKDSARCAGDQSRAAARNPRRRRGGAQ
jgi:hypothetical protein